MELWWNPRGTLVEPSWNLPAGPPRTIPEPIWAETPKLSAVGEKGELILGKGVFLGVLLFSTTQLFSDPATKIYLAVAQNFQQKVQTAGFGPFPLTRVPFWYRFFEPQPSFLPG